MMFLTASSVTLSSVITSITSVISGIMDFCGTFITKLTSNPLTLVILSIAFISAGLAFILRLVRSC